MTAKTTPITVHLTDEQMDTIETWEGIRLWEGSIWRLVCDAVKNTRHINTLTRVDDKETS